MKADPILRELWEIKDDLSKENGHDLRRLFDRLKECQKNHTGRLVNRATRAVKVAEPGGSGYGSQARRT